MSVINLIVKGWPSGKAQQNEETGAGYYIRLVSTDDRDQYFDRMWTTVEIELPNGVIARPSLTPSFWKTPRPPKKPCLEFRDITIGKWMVDNNYAPWAYRKPPTFELLPLGGRRFQLRQVKKP